MQEYYNYYPETNPQGRGGARPGAGRPKLDRKPRCIRLTDAAMDQMRRDADLCGFNSVSEYLESLIMRRLGKKSDDETARIIASEIAQIE